MDFKFEMKEGTHTVLIDFKTDSPEEIAKHFGRFMNACGFDGEMIIDNMGCGDDLCPDCGGALPSEQDHD